MVNLSPYAFVSIFPIQGSLPSGGMLILNLSLYLSLYLYSVYSSRGGSHSEIAGCVPERRPGGSAGRRCAEINTPRRTPSPAWRRLGIRFGAWPGKLLAPTGGRRIMPPELPAPAKRYQWPESPVAACAWRGGRVAEGNGLLNRHRVKSSIGGSNPPLSATFPASSPLRGRRFAACWNRNGPFPRRDAWIPSMFHNLSCVIEAGSCRVVCPVARVPARPALPVPQAGAGFARTTAQVKSRQGGGVGLNCDRL